MSTSVNAAGEHVASGGIKLSPKASGTVLTNVHAAFGRVADKRAVDIDTSEWINVCRAAVPLYGEGHSHVGISAIPQML
jgi:hypothetical protein